MVLSVVVQLYVGVGVVGGATCGAVVRGGRGGQVVRGAEHGEGDVVAQHVEVPRQHAVRVAVADHHLVHLTHN